MQMMIRIGFGVLLAAAYLGAANSEDTTTATRESPPAVWKNPRNHERTSRAFEQVAQEEYGEAEASLRQLLDSFEDPFERSQVLLGLANVYLMTDRLGDALPLYAELIELDVLANAQHFSAMFQLAQLHAVQENYAEALRWIDRWLAESGESTTDGFVLKASMHAELEDYSQALMSIDEAIRLADNPHESWLQLKLACHVELDQFLDARDVLFVLVRGWPEKKVYWTQLSSTLVALKSESQALAVLALANRQGLLDTEADFLQLFSLYGYLDMPYQAASTLQSAISAGRVVPGLATWEKLGNAWYAAQERDLSIVALARAAELAETGKLDMQVAMILVDAERYSEAAPHLRNAIDKGGLTESEIGNLQILLGMTELNNGRNEPARQAFRNALKYSTSQASARQWLNHMRDLAEGTD